MIRTAIVDDEIKGRLYLRQLCDRFVPEIEIVGEAANTIEAGQLVEIQKPDLVFLDIEMPGQSGIDWLRSLPQIQFDVIFVTAFNQYAVEAFRLGAVDYLLKPVHASDLQEAVKRVEKKLETAGEKTVLKSLAQNYGQSFSRISIPAVNGFEFIDFKDIIYMESESNYTTFHLIGNHKITATRTLGEFEELLERYQFFRLHKSFIVNLNYIRKYIKGDGGMVVMENGVEIDVSRRRKEAFLERLKL